MVRRPTNGRCPYDVMIASNGVPEGASEGGSELGEISQTRSPRVPIQLTFAELTTTCGASFGA